MGPLHLNFCATITELSIFQTICLLSTQQTTYDNISEKLFWRFFLSLCLKYGFNFGNEWFWNSPISIFYWGSFQNADIWTRLGTRTKKRRNMQNKNLKKQKKSYLGAKFYACHLGIKWGNLYSLNFTFS